MVEDIMVQGLNGVAMQTVVNLLKVANPLQLDRIVLLVTTLNEEDD